ncbi:sodium:proton antiporter [bacterium]|jgi:Na+/H+ antiporter NhaC|nr:sodium:proton antiporter [bacterium]
MSDTVAKNTNFFKPGFINRILSPASIFFVVSLLLSFYVGKHIPPTWSVSKTSIDMHIDASTNDYWYTYKGKKKTVSTPVSISDSSLNPASIEQVNEAGGTPIQSQIVYELKIINGVETTLYYTLKSQRHWGYFSFLPAIVAIVLCWLTRAPFAALVGGIFSGALLLGLYDVTEAVFVPSFASKGAAGILLLYLFLLGGLMGIWSKTGAAQAFADYMTLNFVKGPKSARLVAWLLGVIFFQGGTVSTVLVGTTVKPLADKERISHEELAYIVDSTASPIASVIAFNAWPGYIQSFIYVAGISWLATEQARLAFFFGSVKYSFYSAIAVLFTFLLCIDKAPFIGKRMKKAIKRSRETGALDAPGAEPLSSKELSQASLPKGYTSHVAEFFVPLIVLIGTSLITYFIGGSPQVRLAFSLALLVAIASALFRGMKLSDLMIGIEDGLKGVVVGAAVLLLAITIGNLSKDAGGGIFLVDLLGAKIPFWLLPVALQILTMFIAFATGTSWGTYAVAFPLAMPLAFAVASTQGVENLVFYISICFAAVLNGSVYGDQCSPISDTTILSSLTCGCDLMDHVKTQIVPASFAAGIAGIGWTGMVLLFA